MDGQAETTEGTTEKTPDYEALYKASQEELDKVKKLSKK